MSEGAKDSENGTDPKKVSDEFTPLQGMEGPMDLFDLKLLDDLLPIPLDLGDLLEMPELDGLLEMPEDLFAEFRPLEEILEARFRPVREGENLD